MKNQYVGDINDYRKYGLIRALVGNNDLKTGIFWMLTEDEPKKNDGQFVTYLEQRDQWQHYDKPLFDGLHDIVHKHRRRDVSLIDNKILPSAYFFAKPLDNTATRKDLFRSAFDFFSGCDLIFFDPDNGLEIASKPIGRKYSNKYLYFSEVTDAFNRGHSLLIYQHFPRINREQYIKLRKDQLQEATACSVIYTFRTDYVCFFLVSQSRHVEFFNQQKAVVSERWENQFY